MLSDTICFDNIIIFSSFFFLYCAYHICELNVHMFSCHFIVIIYTYTLIIGVHCVFIIHNYLPEPLYINYIVVHLVFCRRWR